MNENVINMENPSPNVQFSEPKVFTRKTKRLIFYTLMMAIPVLHFLVFYCYVNVDTFASAFRITEYINGVGIVESYHPTYNILAVWEWFLEDEWVGFWNSIKAYVITYSTSGIFSIFASYYVYKKFMFSGIFKLFLYLPSIVSSVVLTFVYRHLVNRLVPTLVNDTFYGGERVLPALLDQYPFGMVLGYGIFMGLGGNILMYSGTMSGIDDSIVEAAHLDGVNAFQEFWYITLPLIYPTFVTFFVTGLANIFIYDLGLFTFFGDSEPLSKGIHTVGYLLFVSTKKGATINNSMSGILSLNQVATLGLMITMLMLPTSLLVRKVMTKYGPSTT